MYSFGTEQTYETILEAMRNAESDKLTYRGRFIDSDLSVALEGATKHIISCVSFKNQHFFMSYLIIACQAASAAVAAVKHANAKNKKSRLDAYIALINWAMNPSGLTGLIETEVESILFAHLLPYLHVKD